MAQNDGVENIKMTEFALAGWNEFVRDDGTIVCPIGALKP